MSSVDGPEKTKLEKPAKRFATKESSFIEVYGKPDMIPAQLKNLSSTGLCLVLDLQSIQQVNKGDIVRLVVKLKELKKDRIVNAEIIWIRKNEAGLCFIAPNQVLDKLLEKSMAGSMG